MKAKHLFVLLFITPVISSAQLNTYNQPFNILFLGVGAEQTFINNSAFNAWTQTYHDRTIKSRPMFNGELDVITKRFDSGLHVTDAYPFGVWGVYFGERLTRRSSPIASFLNFDLGGFYGHYDNIPPLQTLTPDQMGQKMELHYSSFYIGLSSRNYFNNLHFRIGSKKKGVSINSGFFVMAGYVPFGGDWQYGYNTSDDDPSDDGNGSYFKSNRIKSIPIMSNFFVSTGLVIGISN
jgi:hypothetical protein